MDGNKNAIKIINEHALKRQINLVLLITQT
jgi:hypothetical protein